MSFLFNIQYPYELIDTKYTLLKLIGRGAFGSVYLAKDNNGVEYILKFINLKKTTKEDISNEVKALESISSINECKEKGLNRSVLCLVDSFIYKEFFVMVTNYLENVITLREYINTFKKLYYLDVHNIQFLMTKLFNQLDILHNHNIIHGDIKPENIIVQFNKCNDIKNVMFIDFGNACNDKKCLVGGTIHYMAPELLPILGSTVLKSQQDFKKTDVWSLGVVFYELLNHAYPFPFESDRIDTRESGLLNPDNEFVFIKQLNDYYKQQKKIFSHFIPQDEVYNVFNEIVDAMLTIDPLKRKGIKHFAKRINIFNLGLLQKTSPRRHCFNSPLVKSAPLEDIFKKYNSNPNLQNSLSPLSRDNDVFKSTSNLFETKTP